MFRATGPSTSFHLGGSLAVHRWQMQAKLLLRCSRCRSSWALQGRILPERQWYTYVHTLTRTHAYTWEDALGSPVSGSHWMPGFTPGLGGAPLRGCQFSRVFLGMKVFSRMETETWRQYLLNSD